MNTDMYRYFKELALDRNVTRTAKKVGLTQQALSAQINRLEQNYGVKLFDRENHFELTYAGERLLEYCDRLETWIVQVDSEMSGISGGDRGIIRIGATAKRGYSIFPLLFKPFHEEYPHMQVSVLESRTNELISNVLEQKTDFCFMVSNVTNPRIISIPIFEERIQLFATDNILREYCSEHYDEIIASKDKDLPMSYFAKCPFLLQGENNRVRISCDQIFEKYNIIPNIIFTSTNAMNLLKIAQQGVGATFLNASTKVDPDSNLHRLTIQELSQYEQLKICYLKDHYMSPATKRFIDLSLEILPQQLNQANDLAGLI